MDKAPKSLRLHIGLFGRTNVGKSSFLNMVSGQDVAITSPIPGTTTDVVEKTMELLPIGPVVFLDTAGLDDRSELSERRIKKTRKIFDRSDVLVLIVEPGIWTAFEEEIVQEARKRKIPFIIAVNKVDEAPVSDAFLSVLKERTNHVFACSSVQQEARNEYVHALKKLILQVCPDDFLKPPPLLGDLIPRNGLVVLIVPIDLEAPKGRIILPQVQAIRDGLDHNAAVLVVKESEYKDVLGKLKGLPDLVVCDSQVVDKMVADSPADVSCTTFSILLARWKGDLAECVRGARAIDGLKPNDKILIAESCSHHAIEDDIGRVKIPKWLKNYTGFNLDFSVCSGRDYPENLKEFKLIVHCGACMLTRREMLFRIQEARRAQVPITNYGVLISYVYGVLERVLAPFPEARAEYSGSGISVGDVRHGH